MLSISKKKTDRQHSTPATFEESFVEMQSKRLTVARLYFPFLSDKEKRSSKKTFFYIPTIPANIN